MLKFRNRLFDLSEPLVMGILNATPDSFFDGGKYPDTYTFMRQAEKMLHDGAALLDVGGASTRPGAADVPEDEELRRVLPLVQTLRKEFPEALLSIDTWRTGVARAAVEAGADMVNDVSAGRFDTGFSETVAALRVPYVLMHSSGKPHVMQQQTDYDDVVTEVLDFFIEHTARLRVLGITDIILDPGFGFGKTVEQNYMLLQNLHVFRQVTGLPVLAGLSRKSMICKVLRVPPAGALNGTTALHVIALQQGASILRVHDVREAAEVIKLMRHLKDSTQGAENRPIC